MANALSLVSDTRAISAADQFAPTSDQVLVWAGEEYQWALSSPRVHPEPALHEALARRIHPEHSVFRLVSVDRD